jgi:hypothetical protein
MNRLKLLFTAIIACLSFQVLHASTQINTPTVSGTWTTAGSPYYVNNNISIPYGSVLIINPGVEVIFTGYFNVMADGTLKCKGTDKDNITFSRNDTTGWSNDYINNGGWAGIYAQGNYNNPTADSTIFDYCIFKDGKKMVLNCGANITVNHSEFYHNRSVNVGAGGYNLITLGTVGLGRYHFLNNNVHDNIATSAIMYSSSSDSFFVDNCSFHHNYMGSPFCNANSNLIFTNNSLHDNQSSGYTAPIQLINGTALIRNNKVYRNTMGRTAALSIQSYHAIIEQNLICNNSQTDELNVCGISDGGGGILLFGRNMEDYVADRSVYIVRNNVIANNYSKLGGAGIATRFATSYITNNTIVNNQSEAEHSAFFMWGEYSRVRITNNIIYGNKSDPAMPSEYVNFGMIVCDSLWLGNNLMDVPFYQSNRNSLIGTLKDTISNIIDPVLHLQAPTSGAGYAFDATTADFSLTAAATNCINKGNNAAMYHGDFDYAGNQRIYGNTIDIGAMEIQSGNPTTGIDEKKIQDVVSVYPNPSSDKLYVALDKKEQVASHMQITDITGRTIESLSGSAFKGYVDVSRLTNGVYFLKITTTAGKELSAKFVVCRL